MGPQPIIELLPSARGSPSDTLPATRALRRDASTRQIIQSIYKDDFELWDRVLRGAAPTPGHATNLSAHLRTAADRLCGAASSRDRECFFARPPVCLPSAGCTCPLCCDESLAQPHRCVQCILASTECAGPGVQPALRVPRAVAPVCKSVAMVPEVFPEHLHTCNVCTQCCNQPWVGLSGPSCLACEAKRCPAPPPAALNSEAVLEFERPVEEVEFALPSE